MVWTAALLWKELTSLDGEFGLGDAQSKHYVLACCFVLPFILHAAKRGPSMRIEGGEVPMPFIPIELQGLLMCLSCGLVKAPSKKRRLSSFPVLVECL